MQRSNKHQASHKFASENFYNLSFYNTEVKILQFKLVLVQCIVTLSGNFLSMHLIIIFLLFVQI